MSIHTISSSSAISFNKSSRLVRAALRFSACSVLIGVCLFPTTHAQNVDRGKVDDALGRRSIVSWERRLSESEKQRLSLARALLAEPDLVLLGEATSALEAPAAVQLHREVCQRLPGSAIVSAAHDGELSGLYDKVVELVAHAQRCIRS